MSAPEIGTVMEDGTVYAGISPTTGNMLFVMQKDAPLLMNANVAAGRIEAMNRDLSFGHEDWRLPTLKELKVIFANKEKDALRGTFNETAERNKPFQPPRERTSPSWYRTSDPGCGFTTKGIYFNDGSEEELLTIESSSVRFVREGGPPPKPYTTPDIIITRQDRLNKLAQTHKLVIKPS